MQIKPLLVLVLLLFVFGGGYYLTRPYFVDEEKIFCTLEAKQCPDGSYVSRTGPNCEFAKCPNPEDISKSNFDIYMIGKHTAMKSMGLR